MKLVEIDLSEIMTYREIIEQFIKSGMECAELTEIEGKSLLNIYQSMNRIAHKHDLAAHVKRRGNRIFLVRMDADEQG